MGSNLGTVRPVRPSPQLTRHIDALFPTLEELVEAADAARDVLALPGWDVLDSLLDAEAATVTAELEDRREPLASRADYAHRHGRLGGLKAPRQALLALIDRAESRLTEQRRKHEEDAAEPVSERS